MKDKRDHGRAGSALKKGGNRLGIAAIDINWPALSVHLISTSPAGAVAVLIKHVLFGYSVANACVP